MTYLYIHIQGCDDRQTLSGEFTEDEADVIYALEAAAKVEGGGCVPRVTVHEANDLCRCDPEQVCDCTTEVIPYLTRSKP